MSSFDGEGRRAGRPHGPAAPPDSAGAPYDSARWEAKLREARAQRSRVMEQRHDASETSSLIRPGARPPGTAPATAQDAARIMALHPLEGAGFEPTPSKPASAAPRGVAKPARLSRARRAPVAVLTAVSRARASGNPLLTAFAAGLGLGLPVAGVLWLAAPSGAQDPAPVALAETVAPEPDMAPDAAPAPAIAASMRSGEELPPVARQAGLAPRPMPVPTAMSPVDATPHLASAPATEAFRPVVPRFERDTPAPGADPAPAVADAPAPQETVQDASAQTATTAEPTDPVPVLRPQPRPQGLPTVDPTTPQPPGADMASNESNGSDALVIAGPHELHVFAPNRVPMDQANTMAEALRAAGAQVMDPVATRVTIQDTHLRYYHAADADTAEAIAARIDAEVRDFTGFSPKPTEGRIEMWMAGRGSGGQPRIAVPDSVREMSDSFNDTVSDAVNRLLSSLPQSARH